MDALADTDMPDRCTNAPQKTSEHMGCTDAPKVPMTYGEHNGIWGTYRCTEGVHMYGGHMEIWEGAWTYGCTAVWEHTDAPQSDTYQHA